MYKTEFLLSVGTKKQRDDMHDKLNKPFERQAKYLRDNFYGIPECGLYSSDTNELMKMFVGHQLCAQNVVEYSDEDLFEEESEE